MGRLVDSLTEWEDQSKQTVKRYEINLSGRETTLSLGPYPHTDKGLETAYAVARKMVSLASMPGLWRGVSLLLLDYEGDEVVWGEIIEDWEIDSEDSQSG